MDADQAVGPQKLKMGVGLVEDVPFVRSREPARRALKLVPSMAERPAFRRRLLTRVWAVVR